MTPMTFLRFFAVHAAVFAVATTTEAEPEAMSTSMEPEPAPESSSTMSPSPTTMSSTMSSTMSPSPNPTPTTTPQTYTQTVVQTVTLTNLDDYSDLSSLQAAYTSQMATASNTGSSNVAVTVTAVVVKVTMSLTGVNATHIEQVKQAIADLAGVDVSAVTLVQSRRLLEQSQKLEDERRLATTNWAASITVNSSSGDMVSKAKGIHSALQNDTAVASSVSNQTGSSVTASTTASLELTVSTVIVTSSSLDTSALDSHIGDYFNGSALTTSHTGGASTSTSGSSLLDNTDDAPWGSGYILVGLMSVLFGVQVNCGLYVK